MGDLSLSEVREALLRGLTPLDQRLAKLKSAPVSKAWEKFTRGTTKKLLKGDITVDEWKGALGSFAGEVAQSVGGEEGEAILADANGAAVAVEEVFSPPSPMRWLIVGGIATAAIAYWWLKREEKESRKLLIATPEIIAGTPRRKRPATIDLDTSDVIEAEEV